MKNTDQVIEVVPLVALPPQGNQKYSYIVPNNMNAVPGDLVRIPFSNRIINGVVWSKTKKKNIYLKNIIEIERKNIATKHDLRWLEMFSDYSLESLSLLTKALVSNRKSFTEKRFNNPEISKRHGSIVIKFTEKELEKILKTKGAGQILILIPEIIFGDDISNICKLAGRKCVFYNNQLSQKEKNDVTNEIYENQFCVVIATHSGIFLPFSNLTAIILIEPALPSHRQWNMHPFYDARVGAYLKSIIYQIPLTFLVSIQTFATYSLSNVKNKYQTFEKITVINKNWNEQGFFSDEILNLIKRKISQQNKILIYHDAIGYESFYVCKDCGNTLRCEQCGSILQRQNKDLFCKACKAITGTLQAFCGKCGSPKINALKTGTRSIEQLLKKAFPELNIIRIDKGVKITDSLISSLTDANIVITTQILFSIVNKAFFDCCIVPDFSTVTGITHFDSLEKSLIILQRLNKLIRKNTDPTIYINERNNDSGILKHIKNRTINELIENDTEDRKQLLFPPFGRMLTCEKEFATEILAQKETRILRSKISNSESRGQINIIIFKRQSKYVGQIIIRTNEKNISVLCKAIPNSWSIDVPFSWSNLFAH